MKRGTVLLTLLLILRIAVAQSQPPATTNSKSSNKPGEPSAEHIYGPKDKGVKPPKVKSFYDPEYPKTPLGNRKVGTIVLQLIVGSTGIPLEIKVLRSLRAELDDAAIEAVRKWKFAPATKDGEPVASQIQLEVSFAHN